MPQQLLGSGDDSSVIKPSFWDRRMEYLEGKEITFRNIAILIASVFGVFFLWNNSDAVLEFAQNIELTIWFLVKAILGVFFLYVLTRPALWRALCLLVDSFMRNLVLAVIYRDPVSAAKYDLRGYKTTIQTVDAAKNEVETANNELLDIAHDLENTIKKSKEDAEETNDYIQKEIANGHLTKDSPELIRLESQLSEYTYRLESAKEQLENMIPDLTMFGQNLTSMELYSQMVQADYKKHEIDIENLARTLKAQSARERGMTAAASVMSGDMKDRLQESINAIRAKIARSRAIADSISRKLEPGAVQFELRERLRRSGSVERFRRVLAEGGADQTKIAGLLEAPKEVQTIQEFLGQFSPGSTPAEKVALKATNNIARAKSMLD